jgi:membrane protein YqaA with SNARE-associated domain
MLLVAGIMRYSARKAFLFSMMGLTAKYAAIVYAYDTVSSWF